MERHYNWFRRTQSGPLEEYQVFRADKNFTEGYRWRGQTETHVLPSGLDDYPRAPKPDINDLHLDALCWVGLMAGVLKRLSFELQDRMPSKISPYDQHLEHIRTTLEQLHWSEPDSTYCDISISIDDNKIQHICHKGYISLLPWLTGIIAPPHIASVLDIIENPSHLWSPYGLRSLSTQDELYGTGENYWRSPIWININYLVLVKLKELHEAAGQHAQRAGRLSSGLRRNLVYMMFQSWRKTGMVWEHYDSDTGEGDGAQRFTGWSSLVVRIMAMDDVAGDRQVFGGFGSGRGMVMRHVVEPWTLGGIGIVMLVCTYRRRLLNRCRRLWSRRKRR